MRKPEILSIIVTSHIEVKFNFCLILSLMHEKVELEGVKGQEIIVVLDDIDYLIGCEVRKEVYNELFVVL